MAKKDNITETSTNFSFQKLQGFENYKSWAEDFLTALQTISLHKFILPLSDNSASSLLSLTAEQMTDIVWITAAEQHEKKYDCHHTNNIWVQALILKTVVTSITKEWKSTHLNNTSLYNLWKWLKEQYTEGNVTMKWSVITEVEGMNLSNHTNIDQYCSKYYDLAHQINDLKITLKDTLMLKVLNNLDSEYNQFMTVLMSEVWTKSDDINPEYIWKALEQEKKQAAVRSKQQANAVTTWKDTRGDNNFHIENRHKTCKSCRRAHKTDPSIVCYDKGQTCEECGITRYQRRNHSC